ncbi:MAG TPA: hypothetical protein VNR20_01705 [Terriglobales bacterium]|nr:hypothetical protein [Terriglobales bacterium]
MEKRYRDIGQMGQRQAVEPLEIETAKPPENQEKREGRNRIYALMIGVPCPRTPRLSVVIHELETAPLHLPPICQTVHGGL